MVMRIVALAFFGALFYLGVLRLPHILGRRKALQKGLNFIDGKEIAEYGELDTLAVSEKTVTEEGAILPEAVEIITMLGHIGVDTVLISGKDEKAASETARRLGAVRIFCGTEDFMEAVNQLECEGRRVLYAEDLLAAEEAIGLGRTVRKTIRTNALWTIGCGIPGLMLSGTPALIAFAAINTAAVITGCLKIKKE